MPMAAEEQKSTLSVPEIDQELEELKQGQSAPRAQFMTAHRYNAISEVLNRGGELPRKIASAIVLEFRQLEQRHLKLQEAYRRQSEEMLQIRMDSEDVERLRSEVDAHEGERNRLINRLSNGGGMTMEEASMRLDTVSAMQGTIPAGKGSRPKQLPGNAVQERKLEPVRSVLGKIMHGILGEE